MKIHSSGGVVPSRASPPTPRARHHGGPNGAPSGPEQHPICLMAQLEMGPSPVEAALRQVVPSAHVGAHGRALRNRSGLEHCLRRSMAMVTTMKALMRRLGAALTSSAPQTKRRRDLRHHNHSAKTAERAMWIATIVDVHRHHSANDAALTLWHSDDATSAAYRCRGTTNRSSPFCGTTIAAATARNRATHIMPHIGSSGR